MIFVLQNGETLLWTALDEGHLGLVKTLIQAEADVNQTNKVEFSCALPYHLSPTTIYNQHPHIKPLVLMIFINKNETRYNIRINRQQLSRE